MIPTSEGTASLKVINYEQWIPPQIHSPGVPGSSEMGAEPDNKAESRGTLKRLQKLVRTKKTSTQSLEDVKHVLVPLSKYSITSAFFTTFGK
ncbi:hypothetical protein EK904_006711 [Melospiza melodia maxima]|nr:hypothetical protein EK904_006711 [Melospiza melodia maxima]